MADVFRIIDRFNITERGLIYIIKINARETLRIDDQLYDLHGNKFRIKGIEMSRKLPDDISLEELHVGIMFELISDIPVQGNILVRDFVNVNYLFCSHPLYPCRVDEDYEEEYQAVGLDHACALFRFEDLETGKLSLCGEEISGLTIYRGWMMKPRMYRYLYEQLEKKNILLINTPEEYEQYHLLPGWYDDFKDETAESVWITGNNIEDIAHASRYLEGSYIVKDYVKSRKHEWYDACFIENIRDKGAFEKVVGNFIERQGCDLVGGVVLRKYETLKQMGFHEQSGMPLSEEYRVFIYAGKVLAIDDYWKEKTEVKLSEEEYKWVESIAARVKSNFVTVDLARREDGSLIIMEFGDGQVSGLQQMKADAFYSALKGLGIHNPYTIEDVKRIITTYTRFDIEPEMSLLFRDKQSQYMIMGYVGHVSFQRCGYKDGSGEINYPDLDSLFREELIDGICLERDWYKVTDIWCEPDMDETDDVIEAYRRAAEQRKQEPGDKYHIYKAVKSEIDKWNPYCLLPDAPHNEFYLESERIGCLINYDSSVEKIVKAVSRVFSEAFEPQDFTVEKCINVAVNIRKALDEDKK